MDQIERELMRDIRKHLIIGNQLQIEQYKQTQLKEGDKVAHSWTPYIYVVPASPTTTQPDCIQVLRRDPQREGFTLGNAGSNPILYDSAAFNPAQLLGLYNGAAQGALVRGGILLAGATVTVPSSGGLYVCAISGTTTLTIIESRYYYEHDTVLGSAAGKGATDGDVFQNRREGQMTAAKVLS